MVHVQGFCLDDKGNVQKSDDYHTDAKTCAKCGKLLDRDNIAKSEMSKVKAGTAAGRDLQSIWCANCGQRNIFVLPAQS